MFTTAPLRKAPWLLLLLGLLAACVAISSQSFWIDEAQTALKAQEPTFRGWWQLLDREHSSNMQMPAYMLYIWAWARVFGVSEVALRAANVPWFLLGFFAISHFLRRSPHLRTATLLLYCLHPFAWFYLDEARPYSMQLAGALLAEGALFEALDPRTEDFSALWWWCLCGGVFLLCGAGLLGVPWAAGIALLLFCEPTVRRSMPGTGRAALGVFVPLLLMLALYFGWTIKERVGTGVLSMNAASMASVGYEQLGFFGLGPARDDLRAHSLSALRPFLLPLGLLALPLAAGLLMAARRRFGLPPRILLKVALLATIPTVVIFAVGFARHARILARHLTPLFPFILAAEGFAILLLWNSGRRIGRVAATVIVVGLACSSIELRVAARHAKDDYRSAAAAARDALGRGKTIWWCASDDAGEFYHLPFARGVPMPGRAFWLYEIRPGYKGVPDEIFVSKPDISDPTGEIQAYIAAHHYRQVGRWTAFTEWEKPGSGT